MWLHQKTVEHIVALAFKPQYLAYAHIKKTDAPVPYIMVSYKKIPLTNLELEKQLVFNPTKIGRQLHSLLCEQCLCNADIRISLAGPTIFEHIMASPDIHLEETHAAQLKNLVWADTPIFQNSQADQQHYVCGIRRELLFQYQLLAIKHKLNVTCITTSNQALLYSYHALSPDTINQNCTIPEDIASLVPTQSLDKICSHVPSTDSPLLMAELIGLCLSELTYENN